jgi:hypothetical protein
MASSTYHTILVRATGETVRREALAGEASMKPGHLLEISSGAVVTHNVANGPLVPKLIALESQTPDDTTGTTASIDLAYASGDTVYYAVARPGERYYMWLADNQVVVAGVTPVGSDGAGCVQAISVTTSTLAGAILGVAAESKSTSGAAARLLVDIV